MHPEPVRDAARGNPKLIEEFCAQRLLLPPEHERRRTNIGGKSPSDLAEKASEAQFQLPDISRARAGFGLFFDKRRKMIFQGQGRRRFFSRSRGKSEHAKRYSIVSFLQRELTSS